jgi:hypothetical protein
LKPEAEIHPGTPVYLVLGFGAVTLSFAIARIRIGSDAAKANMAAMILSADDR